MSTALEQALRNILHNDNELNVDFQPVGTLQEDEPNGMLRMYCSSVNHVNHMKKKHVNRDSHIASSPVSQSFFSEKVCC